LRYFVLLLSFFVSSISWAQDPTFTRWTVNIAQIQLAQRSSEISNIHTVADAEARKSHVDTLIDNLIGPLPAYSGPLNAQVTGTIDRGSYHIERILFESMPGLKVSANLYVPNQSGPLPAILFQIGHYVNGKAAEQLAASNLAIKGFVVITFDPLGQAERLQGYNPLTGTSLAGWGVPQHLLAGGQSVLMGQTFAGREVFDAKRSIDYLVSRPEVDATRIGATGCSGGGALTTFVTALDPRIKVAAPACYLNSFTVSLPNGLLGDSEQSWPNFLSAGLDETDFVELFAPRPFLILSTQGDYPSGAQVVYNEAKKWYGLYQASDSIQWVVGPGPHGMPLQDRQAMYAWMIQWLSNGVGDPTEHSITLLPDSALQATPNGYVGGSDLYQIIRSTPVTHGATLEMLNVVRKLVHYSPNASVPIPGMAVDNGSYMKQPFTYSPEASLTLSAELLIPKSPNKKPAIVYVETQALGSPAAVQLAQSGVIVLDLMPRGLPRTDAGGLLGEWVEAELSWLIGRNLPGMRAKDILQALDILLARNDVDPTNISLYANGVLGVTALMAAAVDNRIGTLFIDRTPYSFQPALDSAVHMDLHSAAIPGFCLKWDLSNLVGAMGERKVVWTNPTDWLGNIVTPDATNPRLTASITNKGMQGAQYFVDLTITNIGPGASLGTSVQSLTFQTLEGTGTVASATRLPVSFGDLPAAGERTVRLLLNVPASATLFSIMESGSLTSGVGTGLPFSLSQDVVR
jgi:cephalosporin-C deacetylase-like acetyl esterase